MAVQAIQEKTHVSERRACQLVGLSRTVLHYEPKPRPENEQLKTRLVELAGERRRFRDECLIDHWFTSLAQARILITAWRRDYNEGRLHSALNYQTPSEFAAQHRNAQESGGQKECI